MPQHRLDFAYVGAIVVHVGGPSEPPASIVLCPPMLRDLKVPAATAAHRNSAPFAVRGVHP